MPHYKLMQKKTVFITGGTGNMGWAGFQELLKKEKYLFDDLVTIVELLRSEGGCPWDMEQTHKSIRKDFIEETYEVIEAIDTDDPVLLREELGDVLLQIVFHAQIEEEKEVENV